MKKFSLEINNPPFQDSENRGNTQHKLWIDFLLHSHKTLEENGIFLDARATQRLNNKINEYETNDKIKKEEIEEISDLTYNYRDIVDRNKKNNKLLLTL